MPRNQHAPWHSGQPLHMFNHVHFADHGLAFFLQNFWHGIFEVVRVVAGAGVVAMVGARGGGAGVGAAVVAMVGARVVVMVVDPTGGKHIGM